ncbi:hypothetical protein [Chitinophaga sp. Cy-1792]|uniref:hypothetical protein n=1 Tax=Chitinophaga sp. Cy-1792 TaxID=2608339 RepID=UPI001421D16A|nr:hypothetical protein [Chitinophaga sp. Cy-1792]NIG54908.1 hypothetical protein [Chitinophaga sp. Cy-1792]
MKYIILSLGILLLYACNEPPKPEVILQPPHTRTMDIQLKDTCLGLLTMAIPERYDTSFSWTDFSDCYSCGFEKYRLQPATLPIDKESGFIYFHQQADSVDNITIAYSPITKFDHPSRPDSATIVRHHKEFIRNLRQSCKEEGLEMPVDTMLLVNHRLISVVIYMPEERKGVRCDKIEAYVNMAGYGASITYNLKSKPSDTLHEHFVDRTMCLIKTICTKD